MEMKQNETFFHGTCSNLTPCLFSSKNIKAFKCLSKSKFLSFITKLNPDNGNETKFFLQLVFFNRIEHTTCLLHKIKFYIVYDKMFFLIDSFISS